MCKFIPHPVQLVPASIVFTLEHYKMFNKLVSLTDARDILPDGRQMYELHLGYNFSIRKTS